MYLVYGNHGEAPTQLEDILGHVSRGLQLAGFDPRLAQEPVAGERNVVIECFDATFASKLARAARVPGTRIACIATEFVTDGTFNDFGPEASRRSVSRELIDSVSTATYRSLFPLLRKRAPKLIRMGRKIRQLSEGGVHNLTQYALGGYWRTRFEHFQEISKLLCAIWCVSEHQVAAYRSEFRETAVRLLPFLPLGSPGRPPTADGPQPDVDFLFTGTETPYRRRALETLRGLGFSVVVGNSLWPASIYRHFVSRSKVSLHIRQHERWPYPSNIRYHRLLEEGALTVAERSEYGCVQDRYVVSVDPSELVEACVREVRRGDHKQRGYAAQLRYYADLSGKERFSSLVRESFDT